MAVEIPWTELGPEDYREDDVPYVGIRTPVYRSQAFPPEIFAWLTSELEEARMMDLFQKKVIGWMKSLGREAAPLEHGCLVDGLVAELQYQKSVTLLPWLQRPRMKSQDFFILANRTITECFLIRSDAPFKKESFYWRFGESDAKRMTIDG